MATEPCTLLTQLTLETGAKERGSCPTPAPPASGPVAVVAGGRWWPGSLPASSPHSCCAQQSDSKAAPWGQENVPGQLGVIRHSLLTVCGESWVSDPGGFSRCPPFSHYFKQLASFVGRGDRNVLGPPTLLPFSTSPMLLSPGFSLLLLNLKGATASLGRQ